MKTKIEKPFVTGTSAFGPFTEDSDIDIVMVYYDAERLKWKLINAGFEIKEPGKEHNPVYEGFTFDIAGRTFQIICVRPEREYNEWLYTTDEMRNQPEFKNREKRIKKFTELRKECRD